MSDDNPSERSDLLSGDDASAPVLPRMVDEPAKPVPVVLVAKQSPGLLMKEKGQRVLRRGPASMSMGDSEDAEEYTENRRLPVASLAVSSGKKLSHLSESEDAEESRIDQRGAAIDADNSEADEYSYIGGGGGWSRSESATRGISARPMIPRRSGAKPLTPRSEVDDRSERDDGQSEEVSVSESVAEKERKGRAKYASNKSYEESTDAESASESELPMAKEA